MALCSDRQEPWPDLALHKVHGSIGFLVSWQLWHSYPQRHLHYCGWGHPWLSTCPLSTYDASSITQPLSFSQFGPQRISIYDLSMCVWKISRGRERVVYICKCSDLNNYISLAVIDSGSRGTNNQPYSNLAHTEGNVLFITMLFINPLFPFWSIWNWFHVKGFCPHFNENGYHHDGMIGKSGLNMIITSNYTIEVNSILLTMVFNCPILVNYNFRPPFFLLSFSLFLCISRSNFIS